VSTASAAAPRLRVAVLGAGSIGCYVGGRLLRSCAVTLYARPRTASAIRERGLALRDMDTDLGTVPPDAVNVVEVPRGTAAELAPCDVILVTVKSRDTIPTIEGILPTLPREAVLVSLQNGLDNTTRIRQVLSASGHPNPTLAGMVEFNVASSAPGSYHQATTGTVWVDSAPAAAPLLAAATAAGMPWHGRDDMPAVARAKVLLNLNNAVNALSGLPLRTELLDRDFRRVLALCQEEALAVFGAEGIRPARLSPVPPQVAVRVLRGPTPVFTVLAKAALRIHPEARSSMADDLAAGRRTEISELQDAIVRRGTAYGVPTTVNSAVARLVREAEMNGPAALPHWTGPDLLRAVSRPHRRR
jgi:2-dehydropantoate 2-reductase